MDEVERARDAAERLAGQRAAEVLRLQQSLLAQTRLREMAELAQKKQAEQLNRLDEQLASYRTWDESERTATIWPEAVPAHAQQLEPATRSLHMR
eukprot:SAG31_NODE_2467_length_5652_cov_3.221862_5_plen_95_part_00